MRRSLIALAFALAAGGIAPQAAVAGHDEPARGYYGAGPYLSEAERRILDDYRHGQYRGDGYDRRGSRDRAFACGHERKFKADNARDSWKRHGRSRHCRDLPPGLARYRDRNGHLPWGLENQDNWNNWNDNDDSRRQRFQPYPGSYETYGYDDGYYYDPSADFLGSATGLFLNSIIQPNRND